MTLTTTEIAELEALTAAGRSTVEARRALQRDVADRFAPLPLAAPLRAWARAPRRADIQSDPMGVLLAENARLREALGDRFHLGNLVGRSRAMLEVYDLVNRLKDTKINVLILGETGTGKEMVARAIHFNSVRSRKPFVPINCGAIPEGLVESELFGHKKGAFTHAMKDKAGYLQAADGGTLFLDEVAELPLDLQAKLLRVLQERVFVPVGGTEPQSVDVRVVAATHRALREEGEDLRDEAERLRRRVAAVSSAAAAGVGPPDEGGSRSVGFGCAAPRPASRASMAIGRLAGRASLAGTAPGSPCGSPRHPWRLPLSGDHDAALLRNDVHPSSGHSGGRG
jgi:hypothetical protein